MSYGQNLPWGLRAVKSLGSASWNGQVTPYPIQSGYANNIFQGDPVILYQGFIVSWYDVAVGNKATNPILGVFNGCTFQVPGAANVDPASPGEKYWPSGQITLNNLNATAYIIDDPDTIFNVQTNNSPGITQSLIGTTALIVPTLVGTQVQGNFNTGISTAYLNGLGTAQPGTATDNVVIKAIVPFTNNISGLAYNNVEVLIQNHRFAQRPVFGQ